MADRRGEPTKGRGSQKRVPDASDMEQTRRYRMDLPPRASGRRRGDARAEGRAPGGEGAGAARSRPPSPSRPGETPRSSESSRASQRRGTTRATSLDPRSSRASRAAALFREEEKGGAGRRARRRRSKSTRTSASAAAPKGRRTKTRKGEAKGDRLSFLVTLVVVVLAAVCLGYLIGQYMYDVVMNPNTPVTIEAGPQGAADVESASSDALIEIDYRIQVGAFSDEANANELREELRADGYRVRVTEEAPFRVQIEGSGTREDAEGLVDELEGDFPGAFIL